jgi:hypothetical protein
MPSSRSRPYRAARRPGVRSHARAADLAREKKAGATRRVYRSDFRISRRGAVEEASTHCRPPKTSRPSWRTTSLLAIGARAPRVIRYDHKLAGQSRPIGDEPPAHRAALEPAGVLTQFRSSKDEDLRSSPANVGAIATTIDFGTASAEFPHLSIASTLRSRRPRAPEAKQHCRTASSSSGPAHVGHRCAATE